MQKNDRMRALFFVCIGCVLFACVRNVLAVPLGTSWASRTGMDEVHAYPWQYDAFFIGTSTSIANISNQELYEAFGIAGVSIGEPEQPAYLSRYTLEDALLCQRPAVVFFDTKAIFYSESDAKDKAVERADGILHYSIDAIRSPLVKRKVLKQVKEYDETLDEWDYFSVLYYAHENWKRLTEQHFTGYGPKDCMNGNIASFSVTDGVSRQAYEESSPDDTVKIHADMEKHVAAMNRMCQDAGAQLVLITGYVSTKANHKAAAQLAQKYGIPYIDMNEAASEMGFDNKMDLADGVHFNLSGAVKWTSYLGAWLAGTQNLTDKREDAAYARYEEQRELFAAQKSFMDTKHKLLGAVTFKKYLQALQELEKSDYIVFFAVQEDAYSALDEEGCALLKALGLTKDLRGQSGAGYAAAISDHGISEELSADGEATAEGMEEKLSYQVTGGGKQPSICINGSEYMQKGRGINIVVYHRQLAQAASSVYFDTGALADPPAGRFVDSSSRAAQKQTDVNVWEAW